MTSQPNANPERQPTEKSSQLSEECFRRLSEITRSIAYTCQARAGGGFSIDWLTGAAERITGYSTAEIQAQGCWRFLVVEEDLPLFEKNVVGLSPGAQGSCELRLRHKNGALVWVSSFAECAADRQAPGRLRLYGGLIDITIRKQAETALQKSAARYCQLAEQLPAITYIVELLPEPRTVYISPQVQATLGFTPAEWLADPQLWVRQLVPDDRDRIVAEVSRHNQTGKPFSLEYRIQTRDGRTLWLRNSATCQMDGSGRPATVHGVMLDITERKQAEDALQALSTHLNAVLATIPDIIMEVDNHQIYTWANRAGLEFFGADVVGQAAESFFEGEQETLQTVQPLFDGNEQVIYLESWQRRQDGEKRLLAWWCHTLKDPTGRVIGALSTARDITEHKQVETALQESEEKFAKAFQTSPYSLTLTRLEDDRVLEVNDGFTMITGYTREEALAEVVSGLKLWVHPEERAPAVADLLAGKPVVNREYLFRAKSGQVIVGLLSAQLIHLSDGPCVLTSVNDITARKQAETALQESEERYRSILNAAPDGIVIVDQQGHTLMVSPGTAPLFGFDRQQDLRGLQIAGFIAPEDRERAFANLARAFQGAMLGPIEYRALRADGSAFDMEVSVAAIRDAEGRPVQLVAVVRDVSARKQAEEQMLMQMNELRRWQAVTLGREGRIAELKREVNALAARLGQKPPYQRGEEK